MNKRGLMIAVTLAAAFLLSGFVFADSVRPSTADRKTTESAPPEDYSCTVDGGMLTIVLRENPTTGFSWHYTIKNTEKLEYISDIYTGSDGGMTGAGGTHEFVFRITGREDNEIGFKYYRSFEPENIEGEYTFKVLADGNIMDIVVE
jgi:predicted secreted protein